MPNYRRLRVPGGTYFFTVNLLDRDRALLVEHIGGLRAAFHAASAARPFETVAIAVLPEHLHCIWRLPDGDCDYPTRWRHIKALFARSVPRNEPRSPQRRVKRERGIWQRRYWERTLRDERDLRAHVDYIHFNPVKHGHVACARDWPYSTFHRYAAAGILDPNWGDADPADALRPNETTPT